MDLATAQKSNCIVLRETRVVCSQSAWRVNSPNMFSLAGRVTLSVTRSLRLNVLLHAISCCHCQMLALTPISSGYLFSLPHLVEILVHFSSTWVKRIVLKIVGERFISRQWPGSGSCYLFFFNACCCQTKWTIWNRPFIFCLFLH